jgi:hypothetical protein
MIPEVTSVQVVGPHRLRVTFSDDAVGEIDVARHVAFEGVFEALADPAYFAQVRVDDEAGTLVWPNGADLDPLVLHSLVTGKPVSVGAPASRV